nr:hypothetical protein [Tanacetum cinerariifolium]
MQTQRSNTLHNAIIEAGSKYRPPMLAPGIDNDIYSTVDACPNACEMWKAIKRLKQGESINVQDLETNLYWEFGKFTSQDDHNKLLPGIEEKQLSTLLHPSMIKNRLWLLKMMKMSKDKEIDKLMALISLSFKKIYKPTNNNLRTSSNTSRANQDNSLRINRGVGYDNQRLGNVAGARETVGTQVVHKSWIQYYNCKEFGHVARECQKPKRAKDAAYHREKMLLCKQEEAGIQLNAEQADWRDDTDDELEDQELEAHYMYMAKIQEVTPDAAENSRPIFDTELLENVSNNDNYNVFAIESDHPEQSKYVNDTYPIEQNEHNVIIDSLDMSYDREQIDQNDDDNDLANERELLASLIEKLKCEIDDSKNRNNFLETSNKVLVKKLKGEIEDFKNKNKSLESSNNHFKEANNELSETNKLLYNDFKKSQAKLERRNDVEYASKVEIDLNVERVLQKPKFLKKAQRANPRLYDIGCYNDNRALMLAPESVEVIRLEKESRSKLSDLIRPFDYEKLNNLYDLFVPQREQSYEQRYFSERSRLSHTPVNNGNSKESFNKQTTMLDKWMDESIPWDQKFESSKELFKIKRSVGTIFDGVEQQFHLCLQEEMVADLRYFNSLELEVDSLRSQLETQKTQFLNEIDRLSREYYYAGHMNAIFGVYTELDEKHAINLELELQQCKEKIKNEKSFKVNQSKDFCKEREQYFEIQDLKAQLQDKGIAISELKKLIGKLKGKSVDTKFEKSSVIRQPNAFKSQRPSILGKPTIFSDSLERKDFSKSQPVTKNNVSNDFSKPVTAQILPTNKKSILKNTNVLAQGMYKLHTKPTQTRTSELPNDSRKTNERVSFSTGVIPKTSVSRPQLKCNQLEDRVLRNNSQEKKQEVEYHRRNVKFSKNKMSVTACNDSLNAKSLNVTFVCAKYGKCVLNEKHDMCVLKSRNGVNSRTKMPIVVPVSTRKLYECVSKACSWWYHKFTPPGYNWTPKSKIGNVKLKVSMPLGNVPRTANVLEPMTSRCSTVSNTPLSSNFFAARRDYPIHHRLWEYGHVARECQKPKRAKDAAYHREKMLLYKKEEAGIQLNAEQADWKDDTNDESDDQELEAHYMYMAKIQEVSPYAVDTGPIFDKEPEQKGAHNVIIESVDMNYDSEQIDQNDEDVDLAKERELLASLIEKLKCEIDETKNRNTLLETSNKVLVEKLKSELEDFRNKNKSLTEANNKLSEENDLLYADFKKSKAELKRGDSIEYASEMELECAKVRGDLLSYKMEYE